MRQEMQLRLVDIELRPLNNSRGPCAPRMRQQLEIPVDNKRGSYIMHSSRDPRHIERGDLGHIAQFVSFTLGESAVSFFAFESRPDSQGRK